MNKPSAILFGSKPGSVVALELLLARGWSVPAVVVSRSLGHPWIPGKTLESAAKEYGIPIFSQSQLPPVTADFVLSYMYRFKVRPHVIAAARRAALNFHAGPLPEFGGWAFYNVAILEQVAEYGCSCHYISDDFDAGDLFQVDRFPVDMRAETCWSLERKTQEQMIQTFVSFCEIAESEAHLPRLPQDRARFRYMSKDEFECLKEVPYDADAETIDRYARAFWYPPYQCAFIRVNDTRVDIFPNCEKEHIASLLHRDDYKRIVRAASLNLQRH